MESSIKLAHGNGGLENQELIEDIFFKNFQNPLLKSEDSALIEEGKLAFTTDSYTISPIFLMVEIPRAKFLSVAHVMILL